MRCETDAVPARRRLIAAAALGSATLVAAACGTRLPDASFVQAQQLVQTTASPGATVGPGGSTPPPGVTPGAPGSSTGPGGPVVGPTSSSGPTASTGPGGWANFASDVGVTATTITIGSIVSKTNPFDPRAFVGPSYGLEAFVHWTNAHGGINGRQLVLETPCDDQGSGNANVACVHQLIDSNHVFALVSNAILDYAGADYVNSKGVPDIGSQPIDNAYNRYPHLWDLYGEDYPRDGKQTGFGGKLYGGTEVYQYFADHFPKVKKVAGVVVYNQDASQRFGNSIAIGLHKSGYSVDEKVVNFALPDFDSVAIDFKNKGVQYVYDTIDREGNVRLCKALDDNKVSIFAKVLTPQSWEQSVGADYSGSPNCRDALWATGNTLNYADTKFAPVKDFREQMAADGHGGSQDLSEWALEGWAGAQWFADAVKSCGAAVTRRCVEAFVNNGKPYGAGGLLTPRVFHEYSKPHEPQYNCINVVRWVQSAGTWVTQVPDMDKNCFTTNEVPYAAS